ncbi:unnamed protein product, partial [Rotaria magnacalcarata]
MYTFIGIDGFGETDVRNIDEKQKSLLHNQLKPSSDSMLHLILLVTTKDEVVSPTYNYIYDIISDAFRVKVPVLVIVSNCERDADVQQWVHCNRKLLDKNILPFEDIRYLWRMERQSKSLEEIWEAIKKYALNQEQLLTRENNISTTSNQGPATSATSLPIVENAAATNAKRASTTVSKTQRRIFVYDSSKGFKTNIITLLSGQNYSTKYLSNNIPPSLPETDPCIYADRKYSFIDVSQLQQTGFNKIDQGQQSSIHKRTILGIKIRDNCSESIDKLWQAIEQYSKIPSIVMNDDQIMYSTFEQSYGFGAASRSSGTKDIGVNIQKSLVAEVHRVHDQTETSMQDDYFKTAAYNLAKEIGNDGVPGFFNKENTNIQILIDNCTANRSENSPNNCVLIITGSMNPVHRSHIGNLELVKQHIEQSDRQWKVLAGYLSPTQAESEYYDGFVDFPEVTKTLSQFLNSILFGSGKLLKYPLYVVYVCGLDHFNKCPDVLRLSENKFIKCAVVSRKGCDERRIRRLDESSNIIYVPLDDKHNELSDISSTEIRARLKDSNGDLRRLT